MQYFDLPAHKYIGFSLYNLRVQYIFAQIYLLF